MSEKLSAEQDDETLVKTVFKTFKGSKTRTKGPRDFSQETLSFEEFRDVMKNLPEFVSEEDIKAMFNAADEDRDGNIDVEEFGRMVSRYFKVPNNDFLDHFRRLCPKGLKPTRTAMTLMI